MKIGFTGTQRGMNSMQKFHIEGLLFGLSPDETHSGDCVGADKEFVELVQKYSRQFIKNVKIICHPPINELKRAFCLYNEERKPLEYLHRNKNIVNECDILIAAPATDQEQLRSGTWSTIRYAKEVNKKLIIVKRDGLTETNFSVVKYFKC